MKTILGIIAGTLLLVGAAYYLFPKAEAAALYSKNNDGTITLVECPEYKIPKSFLAPTCLEMRELFGIATSTPTTTTPQTPKMAPGSDETSETDSVDIKRLLALINELSALLSSLQKGVIRS